MLIEGYILQSGIIVHSLTLNSEKYNNSDVVRSPAQTSSIFSKLFYPVQTYTQTRESISIQLKLLVLWN